MKTSEAVRAYTRLLVALRSERAGMIRGFATGAASAIGLAALSALIAGGVGGALVTRTWPPAWWTVAIIVLVLVRAFLTWHEMDVSHALAYRVLARLRAALFDSSARSTPARRREHSARGAAAVLGDIEKLEFFYAHTVAQLATSALVFALSAIASAVLLPAAALVVLVGGALVLGSTLLGARAARRLGSREQREREQLTTGIVDALGALREVLAAGLEPRVIAGAQATTRRSARTAARTEMLAQTVSGVRELVVAIVIIGVVLAGAAAAGLLGGDPVSAGTAATLPALIAIAVAGVAALSDATATIGQLGPLAASAQNVAAGFDRPRVIGWTRDGEPLPDGPLGIRFSAVGFSYDERTAAISDWSATVRPGAHVGLAGASGAGKSTLLALAGRLWDPDSGAIELVDEAGRGYPLDAIADTELRAAVGFVEQDGHLFPGTLRDNLLRGAGAGGCSDADLRSSLAEVGADGWITLDDELGEQGVRLSGGQHARLRLARALLRRPRVLIVDEITASLDPDSERVISDAIARFPGTVLAASHRAETLERFDEVLRLDPTRVARVARSGEPAGDPEGDSA
ncbi:ABC transporter ATP-binding protein [Leucobacter iarius]|uniref:ABC transporter ATP-binding protein n=1 Tax=Leucobacter iarius TaxID=333963 RepID=A0ABP4XZS9_9MICO